MQNRLQAKFADNGDLWLVIELDALGRSLPRDWIALGAHKGRNAAREYVYARAIDSSLALDERGVDVDHTTLYRWVQHYGFKSLKTAYATIKGFEVMHALRKGQAALWQYGGGVMGEVHLIERNFGVSTV